MSLLLNPRDVEFVLYELLDTEALVQTERYAAHDRETFNGILDAVLRELRETGRLNKSGRGLVNTSTRGAS